MEQGNLGLATQKILGPEDIPPQILEKIVVVGKKPLAYLLKFVLLFGIFMCAWEESYIVHLLKSSDKKTFRTIVEYLFYWRLFFH
jgi:hypothetical protein